MKMKKTILSLCFGLVAIFVGTAHAANYCADQFTDGPGNAADGASTEARAC